MGRPSRRSDEYCNYQGHRDYCLQDKFPTGPQGYVVEDVDMLIRVHGDGGLYQTDSRGRFMLIEVKYYPNEPNYAQRKTFGLLDDMLKVADSIMFPNDPRYLGYHVVQYNHPDWNLSEFWVDGKKMSRAEFDEFISLGYLKAEPELPPDGF